MTESHTIFDGRIHVYKRDDSRYWQCAAFLNEKNFRVSTREESLSKAKDFAEDWYLELRGKHKRGELIEEKTFNQAADQFLREYPVITEGNRNKVYVKGHEQRLALHLRPFFGDLGLSQITAGRLQEYRIHRRKTGMERNGKPPARNTMHQEIVTLRQVLKTALRHEWLRNLPDLSEPYKTTGKISHRAWFSPEEYKTLYQATRERADKPKRKRWAWESAQLHDYVLFMANTGLRPDEAARLEFRDVTIVEDEDTGETILEIEVRGKRGVGYCKSTAGAVIPFRRLKDRLRLGAKPKPTEKLFPKGHREMFNIILNELNLKFDREGSRRTSYSLRHTYICLRLMEGADIYQIAKNCRTSVEMIENYYAAHIKTSLDAAAINTRRKKKGKKAKKPLLEDDDL
ncbi:MAG: tyrosine-type recombinase/integrase [Alphaproteobacteria bacterium]